MTRKNLPRASAALQHRRVGTPPPWPEHSLVRLSSAVETDDGGRLPEGSVGAVVGVWQNGAAYEVEFEKPFSAVVTVAAAQLEQAAKSA